MRKSSSSSSIKVVHMRKSASKRDFVAIAELDQSYFIEFLRRPRSVSAGIDVECLTVLT